MCRDSNWFLLNSRLYDVLHSEKKLTLVFEYCDQDLKKYFDSCNGEIDQDIVRVNLLHLANNMCKNNTMSYF